MPRHNHTSKHRPFSFTNHCAHKRKYPDEKQAQNAAELQMLFKPGLELSVYQCELCTKWHLTRQADRQDHS